jgi:hypothetical protein
MPLEYRLTGVSRKGPMSANATISSKDRPAHIDVLAAGQLRVKAGPRLQQGAYPSFDPGPSLGRRDNARKNLEEGTFTGAITSNDPDYFALLHLQRHVSQCPDGVILEGGAALRSSQRNPGEIHQVFPERAGTVGVSHAVLLAELFDLDGDTAHSSDHIGEGPLDSPKEIQAACEQHCYRHNRD